MWASGFAARLTDSVQTHTGQHAKGVEEMSILSSPPDRICDSSQTPNLASTIEQQRIAIQTSTTRSCPANLSLLELDI